MKKRITLFIGIVFSTFCQAYDSQPMQNNGLDKNIKPTLFVDGITIPWAMVQLPTGEMLISEREGKLRVVNNGNLLPESITGLPEIHSNGQGGLLDLALHPDFVTNQWIYFTYASKSTEEESSNTALMRAKLNIADFSLTEQKLLYSAKTNAKSGRHYGSRIVFDDKGFIYFSIGDRGQRDTLPQDLTQDGGKIYRLRDDGSIPSDNPFVNQIGAKTAIYSFGHRNPQGLSIDQSTQKIWSHEHGPKGGDEVNLIKKGANYGWPVISYGVNYNGTTFTDKTEMESMEQPALYWTPSIAPSGMIYVTGDKYPAFKGKLLVGSLKFSHLVLLTIKGDQVVHQEKIFENIGRSRSLFQGIDGYIYVGIDGTGIKRLSPNE